jgi:DNA replication protein DnaC
MMRYGEEIINNLQARLTVLAELQGEACPSFEFVMNNLGNQYCTQGWSYEYAYELIEKWLQKAPAPDSENYASMREKHIVQVVTDELRLTKLPPRHANQSVECENKDWAAAFLKISNLMAKRKDSMFALLGSRGTGKTQMAIELIRFMARRRVEENVTPVCKLERWAWDRNRARPSQMKRGFALYSNTMDFFLQLRKTYQSDSEEHEDDVLANFINPSLLILDEAHDRRGSNWENQMFTHLIDQRYQASCKQTVFIANQTAQEFEENVGSSIADRLQECGGIVNCNWKSFRSGK